MSGSKDFNNKIYNDIQSHLKYIQKWISFQNVMNSILNFHFKKKMWKTWKTLLPHTCFIVYNVYKERVCKHNTCVSPYKPIGSYFKFSDVRIQPR